MGCCLAAQYIIDIALFEQSIGTASGLKKAGQVFLSLLPDWRLRVDAAMAASNWGELSDQLHRMKGCCSMMCATTVAQHLQLAESHLRHRNTHGLLNCLDALETLLREMEAELRHVWLGR